MQTEKICRGFHRGRSPPRERGYGESGVRQVRGFANAGSLGAVQSAQQTRRIHCRHPFKTNARFLETQGIVGKPPGTCSHSPVLSQGPRETRHMKGALGTLPGPQTARAAQTLRKGRERPSLPFVSLKRCCVVNHTSVKNNIKCCHGFFLISG